MSGRLPATLDQARRAEPLRPSGFAAVDVVLELLPLLVEPVVRAALLEDLGRLGDLTTQAVVPAATWARAGLVARQAGRIAGLPLAAAAFRTLDSRASLEVLVPDGRDAAAGEVVAMVDGPARALLSAERVALNFVGRLSGIATITRDLVAAVGSHSAKVVSTRKTTPGLRALELYAVRAGGGGNHRAGLDDAVLIKDNHVAIAGSVTEAIARARAVAGHMVKIEVEVDTLEQLREALAAGIDVVLLDNMPPATLAAAVEVTRAAERSSGGDANRPRRVLLEASGGITAASIAAVAATGVDLISVGWLTHSAPSLDVALDIEVL